MNLRHALFCTWLLALPAAAGETSLDDFEGAGAPAPWTTKVSGAKGQLTLGPGHTGSGAQLGYQFTATTGYVGMNLALTPALTTDAIGFWAQELAGVQLWLVLVDATGQELEYYLPRPLTAMTGNGWFRQVVELDAPTAFTAGANDGKVHAPLATLGLFVINPDFAQLSGTLGIDEVVAISPLQGDLALDAADGGYDLFAASQADLFDGVGVNIHFAKDDPALDIAKAAGFRWVRMDAAWGAIEQKLGVYDFADDGGLDYDALVAALQARSMQALLILDYSNPLYPEDGTSYQGTEENSPASPVTIAAYSHFATALAAHYAGQGVRYEIWNEPNGNFWFPTPNVAHYVTLANSAMASIHGADPTALVTTAGLDTFDWPFLIGELGGITGEDAIGIHPYRAGAPETVSDDLYELRWLMQSAGIDAGAWQTEWGYDSAVVATDAGAVAAARLRQGITFVREILACRMAGFPFAILYDISDDGTDLTNPEDNFGLVDNAYHDKPAIIGIRTLNGIASGRSMVGAYEMTPSSLHAVRFEGPSDVAVALWEDNLGGSVAVSFPNPASAVDFQGNDLSLTAGDGGLASAVINEADGPIYLTWPKAPPASDGGLPDGGSSSQPAKGHGCSSGAGGEVGWCGLLLLALVIAARRRVV